jgi:replication factor A1
MLISDHTGSSWVTAFNETAEKIVGLNANDVHNMKQNEQHQDVDNIFINATFNRFTFGLTAEAQNYQDSLKVRVTTQWCNPIDYVAHSKDLLTKIEAYQMS